ncbi:hypothetical protein CRYUN_Cryun25bG0055400 [Craigia yunnanensis]
METCGVVAGVPLVLLFTFTGILINVIQVACYLTIRPLSKSRFRRINGAITELLWLELAWMMEWWSGFEVKLYTDFKTCQLMGNAEKKKKLTSIIPKNIKMIFLF